MQMSAWLLLSLAAPALLRGGQGNNHQEMEIDEVRTDRRRQQSGGGGKSKQSSTGQQRREPYPLPSLTLTSTNLPIEPPADSWQNSYSPSKTGQSSPTLTRTKECQWTAAEVRSPAPHAFCSLTSRHLLAVLCNVFWRYGLEEVNVVVRVVLGHVLLGRALVAGQQRGQGEEDQVFVAQCLAHAGLR